MLLVLFVAHPIDQYTNADHCEDGCKTIQNVLEYAAMKPKLIDKDPRDNACTNDKFNKVLHLLSPEQIVMPIHSFE